MYPDLLGTYGDSGNAQVLAVRARMRGLLPELVRIDANDSICDDADIYVLGGGEDGPQQTAVSLAIKDGGLHRAFERGAQFLAICAGFQIMGESFSTSVSPETPGLGLIPVITRRSTSRRCVGELLLDPDPSLGIGLVSGYENHGGVSEILTGKPLGKVLFGIGNSHGDKVDGYLSDTVIASYGHGPLLARNPGLCDVLLGRVAGADLGPLLDDLSQSSVLDLRHERISAVGRRHLDHLKRWIPPLTKSLKKI